MARMTAQKKILHEATKSFTSFFDAEQLYQKAMKKDSRIGIATVYRFLKESDLHSYMCNNRKIYSVGKHNHVHFTCERCQQTHHVNIKNIDFIKDSVPGNVCHFQIDLTGTCTSCLKQKGDE